MRPLLSLWVHSLARKRKGQREHHKQRSVKRRLRTQTELDGAWAETHPLFCVEAVGIGRRKKDVARRPQMNLQVDKARFSRNGSAQDLINTFRKYSKCPGLVSSIYRKKTGDLQPQTEWRKLNLRVSCLASSGRCQTKSMAVCHCPLSDKLQLPSFSLSLSPTLKCQPQEDRVCDCA